MCGSLLHNHVDPSDHNLGPAGAGLFFDPNLPAVIEVDSGTTIEVETRDCAGGLIQTNNDLITHIDDLIEKLGGLNYVTGPIAVRGVRPGDVLRVTVVDIDPAPTTGQGFIAVAPGFGALVHDSGRGLLAHIDPATTICTVNRDEVVLPFGSGKVSLPCRPFIGTIGVAPKWERRMTLSQSPEYLGDLDIPQFGVGSTMHMRAHHAGGLISIGDVHAVQGDGEVGGIAVEIDARVKLHIDVTPRGESQLRRLPLLVDSERIGVVAAFQGLPTNLCVRSASVELAEMLVRLGMTMSDAIQYLSAAAQVRLGNMFEPFYSVYVYLERKTIPVRLPKDLEAA